LYTLLNGFTDREYDEVGVRDDEVGARDDEVR
jgi:hypothetical protein